MARLYLNLMGGFQARLDEVPITGFKTKKVRALLAYLAIEKKRPHHRSMLAGLLWPGYLESSARASLRNTLTQLRQLLGEDQNSIPFLIVEGDTLQFNPTSDHRLDVDLFRSLVFEERPDLTKIQRLEAAVNLSQGAFLEGFALKDSPEFDTWSEIVGEELKKQQLGALNQLAEAYEQQREWDKAIGIVREQLKLEPTLEEAHRQLMRLLAINDERSVALAQYKKCQDILSVELGIEPDAQTIALYEQIRTGTITKEENISEYIPATEPVQPFASLNNLPLELTSFIGRRDEIRQVQELLQANRLVTVIGHGGIGKTRLAIEVSRAVLERFPDGIWLVDLAPLSDPEKVAQSAARAVGIMVDTGAQALEALLDYLRPRQMLLVLDNCEHLIEACAQLVEAVMTKCPQVKILATSREPLGTTGETVYYLPSLSVPNLEELPDIDQIRQFEAIELFISRASAVQSQFSLEAHNASDVARVCAQLDGIPLAIELAAAWVRTLPVDQIFRSLSENIDFLRSSSRTALPRHQTLRACLDWSYNLLSPGEQDLLQMFSVFAGGWTLEAAEAVFEGSCETQFEVLDILDQLGAKSLVIVEHHPEIETRYRLLEPVRQYASEKLFYSGEVESARDRHLAYYQFLTERAKPHLRAHRQIEWLRRLERELGNIRVALDWSYSEDGPMQRVELGLRIAADLLWFWQSRCRHMEGFQWLERLLELEQQRRADQPISQSMRPARAWALTNMVALTGHILQTLDERSYNFPAMLDESLALFNQMGETGKRGLVITNFWLVSLFYDNLDDQFDQLERLFTEFEALGDKSYMAICLLFQGIADYDHPEKHYQKSISLCEQIGDREIIPFLWASLGNVA
ncbi:MAG: AfsR/SARP family transcriptional regulator, partial [Anaerolineales bacterium]